MPSDEQAPQPGGLAEGLDLPTNFPNLKPEFAKEIAADLQGLAEALDAGDMDGLGFLQFTLNHLHKIDEFIEFNWT